MARPFPPLVIVTDRRLADGAELTAKLAAMLDAVPGGWVQVREKDLEGRALLALVEQVVTVARPRGGLVLVNDRLDVALAAGADGVHLPEAGATIATSRAIAADLGRQIIIGCSRHSAAAALEAARAGADLVVLGPIWPTPSKAEHGAPLGSDALRLARQGIAPGTALCAIGGIDGIERAQAARAAGADTVAAIRALWTAADAGAAASRLAGRALLWHQPTP